jgi:hypothetical protein
MVPRRRLFTWIVGGVGAVVVAGATEREESGSVLVRVKGEANRNHQERHGNEGKEDEAEE